MHAPAPASRPSLGLRGMRERAAHFGASLQIESHIGLGSAFTLRWPLLKYE